MNALGSLHLKGFAVTFAIRWLGLES